MWAFVPMGLTGPKSEGVSPVTTFDTERDGPVAGNRPAWFRLTRGSLRRHVVVLLALCLTGVVGGVVTRASAAGSAASDRLGFMPGGSVAEFQALESFVGHPAKFVSQNVDMRNASQAQSSVWGEVIDAGRFQTINNRVTFVLAVPLTLGLDYLSTNAQRVTALQATASGANDFTFRLISQYLKQGGFPDAIIRLGWEFDGYWMPWSSVGNEALWLSAYRHVHDIMRAESPGFRFDWNGDPGFQQYAERVYPGDSYVDFVGYDVYDQPPGIPWNASTKTWVDPNAAWAYFVPYLQWQRNFAIAHGKQVSYPEWALSGPNAKVTRNVGGDDPTFIQGMYDWMNSLPASGPGSLAYHSYFNEDTDSNHRINGGAFPNASARFQALFGSNAPETTVAAPTTTVAVRSTTAPPPTTVAVTTSTVPSPATTVPRPPLPPPVTGPQPSQTLTASSALTNVPKEFGWPGARSARYICCWDAQGQYVAFSFATSAGPTALTLRYSAGSGNARRKIEIDGRVWYPNETFPRTASWSAWTTLALQKTLSTGRHTLKIWFDHPAGSTQWLNLDALTIASIQALPARSAGRTVPLEHRWTGAQSGPYVCCWKTQGQFVTFSFSTAGGGTTLALRYSAGGGNARRKIEVDGKPWITNQTFAKTKNWNTWSTLALHKSLKAGRHTLKLWFDAPAGSTRYLNLDNLEVSAM